MTRDPRPPRPTVPTYSPEERKLVEEKYAATYDEYAHEEHFYPDGRTETRALPENQTFRILHDRTDAPTSPVAHVAWGHIVISSAKAQADELEASVGALESLPYDDWLAVRSVSCKRSEYVIEFIPETGFEIAKDIGREFAGSVVRLGGGHNGVIIEVGGSDGEFWTIGPDWGALDDEPPEAA
jgi:hypothetical protein